MDNNKNNDVEILEDNEEIITLFDSNDNPVDFYQIACIEHEDEFYAIMQPAEDVEGIDDDTVMVFKIIEEDEDNDLFIPVEDDDLIDILFDKFAKAVEQEEQKEKEEQEDQDE